MTIQVLLQVSICWTQRVSWWQLSSVNEKSIWVRLIWKLNCCSVSERGKVPLNLRHSDLLKQRKWLIGKEEVKKKRVARGVNEDERWKKWSWNQPVPSLHFCTYVLLHLKGEHKSQVDFVLSFLFFRHRKKNKGKSDGKIEIRRESCE